ncbi:unnamed protein product [Ectocarpus sp. 4 AP-2014]
MPAYSAENVVPAFDASGPNISGRRFSGSGGSGGGSGGGGGAISSFFRGGSRGFNNGAPRQQLQPRRSPGRWYRRGRFLSEDNSTSNSTRHPHFDSNVASASSSIPGGEGGPQRIPQPLWDVWRKRRGTGSFDGAMGRQSSDDSGGSGGSYGRAGLGFDPGSSIGRTGGGGGTPPGKFPELVRVALFDPDYDTSRQHLVKLFNALDTNGSGTITYEAMRMGLANLGTYSDVNYLMRRAEMDKTKEISLDGFVDIVQDYAEKVFAANQEVPVSCFCYDYSPEEVAFRWVKTGDPNPPSPSVSLRQLMAERDDQKGDVRWVCVTGSDPSLVIHMANRFGIHPLQVEDCLNPRERLKVDAFRATPVKASRVPSATYKFQAPSKGTKGSTNDEPTVSTTLGRSTEVPMPASTSSAVAAPPPTTTTTTATETVDSAAEAAAELEASAAMKNEVPPSLTSMLSGAADQSEGVSPRHPPARPEVGRVSPVKIAKLPRGADPDTGGAAAGAGSAARGEISAGSGDGGDVSALTPDDDGGDPAAPGEEILHVVLGRISLREPTLGRPSNFEREQVSVFLVGDHTVLFIEPTRSKVSDQISNRIYYAGSKLRLNNARYLVYSLMDSIVDDVFPIMQQFQAWLVQLQEQLHSEDAGPSLDIVRAIQQISRDMHMITFYLRPMKVVATQLITDLPGNDADLKRHLEDLRDHLLMLEEQALRMSTWSRSLNKDWVNEQQHRMNQVVYILTMVTSAFMPAQFLTGVFGMNFKFMPELNWRYVLHARRGLLRGVFVVLCVLSSPNRTGPIYVRSLRWGIIFCPLVFCSLDQLCQISKFNSNYRDRKRGTLPGKRVISP